MKKKVLYSALLMIILTISPSFTWAWSGKVVGIEDGDTITVLRDKEQVIIRLYGIDCPEGGDPFGKEAKQYTSEMVFGKIVEVEPVDIDRYGRTEALVTIFQRLVNEGKSEGCKVGIKVCNINSYQTKRSICILKIQVST